MPLARQVVIIFCGNEGLLDDLPIGKVKPFEKELFLHLDRKHAAIFHEIQTKKVLDDALKGKLKAAIQECKEEFKKKHG
jgi:F-type H+-transporting ATPase subunit alpha